MGARPVEDHGLETELDRRVEHCRTEEPARTDVPTLVVSAPAEPVFPPPHPQHPAQAVRGARPVEIPGMGHALPPQALAPPATAVLDHTAGR